VLVFLQGAAGGLFAAPNTALIMSAVPAHLRGAASGMRSTFQNAGMVLSIGVFFSFMVAGLSHSLPTTLHNGLTAQGVPDGAASQIAGLPPVGTLFAAFLGYNPIQQLLGPHLLGTLPAANVAHLTGREFFPDLISGPFHDGLAVAFGLAIVMGLLAAAACFVGKPGVPGAKAPAATDAGPTDTAANTDAPPSANGAHTTPADTASTPARSR